MRNSLLHSQKIYDPNDSALLSEQEHCMECLYDYNATRPSEKEKRTQLLHTMLAECGKGCWIEPPFHANWGGRHLHLGNNVYANFGLTCVDDTHIYISDHTMLGPNCILATASHPILPELREKAYQYIDQLWAEAMILYNSGNYKLAFSPAMQETLQAHQQDFMQEDAQAGMIYAFLEDYTGDRVCSKQLYTEALGNTTKDFRVLRIGTSIRVNKQSFDNWFAAV